jgi:Thioredoxin-like
VPQRKHWGFAVFNPSHPSLTFNHDKSTGPVKDVLVMNRFRIVRCLMIFALAFSVSDLAALACVSSAVDQAVTQGEKNADRELVVSGQVFLPDGSPATGIVVKAIGQRFRQLVSARTTEHEFTLRISPDDNATTIHVTSADGKLQAIRMVSAYQVRTWLSRPLKLALRPTRIVKVHVSRRSQPVKNATVDVFANGMPMRGTTNSNGVAEIRVPELALVDQVVAWASTVTNKQIGGQRYYQAASSVRAGDTFSVKMMDCRAQRIQLRDEAGKPLLWQVLEVNCCCRSDARKDGWLPPSDGFSLTTNGSGEALIEWMPEWEGAIVYSDFPHGGWVRLREETAADGTLNLIVKGKSPRLQVSGTLPSFVPEMAGMRVELFSFQGETESSTDVVNCRVDRHGQFHTSVLPGALYNVFVSDTQYASDTWTGVIADSDGLVVNSPTLDVYPGIPVEIQVTQGAAKRPMANTMIRLESPRDFEWEEDGETQFGTGGRGWLVTTDGDGFAQTVTAPGPTEARVSVGDWDVETKSTAVVGEPTRFVFHRDNVDRTRIQGQLIVPDGSTAGLSNAAVTITAMDGETVDVVKTTSDANGGFEAGVLGARVVIVARTENGAAQGSLIVDVSPGRIPLRLHPTRSFRGQVVGPDNQPLPETTVKLRGRIHDWENYRGIGVKTTARDFINVGEWTTKTDKEGFFDVPLMPQRTEISVYVMPTSDPEDRHWFGRRWMEPNVTPPPEVFRIGTTASTVARPLIEQLADHMLDCRLTNAPALIIVSHSDESTKALVRRQLFECSGLQPDVDHYLPKWIRPKSSDTVDLEFLASNNWTVTKDKEVLLVVHDSDGPELGRLTIDLSDEATAAHAIAAFLQQHLPAARDARLLYDKALQDAAATGTKVWVCVGQTRCAPCFALARWMHSQEKLLRKDYLVFKFDNVRDVHGQALSESLGFHVFGVPCHAIVDPNGQVLINSIGPLGNIGSPVADAVGSRHLRKMLRETAVQLTPTEIDQLINSLQP